MKVYGLSNIESVHLQGSIKVLSEFHCIAILDFECRECFSVLVIILVRVSYQKD